MNRVAMLISNGYDPDVRAQKEAHTLALAGHHVTVIAWDRTRQHPAHGLEAIPAPLRAALAEWPGRRRDEPPPISIVRVQVPAGYRTGRRLLRAMPAFWRRALDELRRVRPDAIHAHDLDTLPLAYLYHRMSGVPVIYDSREFYPGMVQANVGPTLYWGLDRLDHWLTPRTAAVVTVGERLAARHCAMGGRVWVVHNSQPLPQRDHLGQEGRRRRAALGIPDGALLVVYVGNLTPDRLLLPMIEAVRATEGVWMVIGGDGPQQDSLRAYSAGCARLRLLGRVPLSEVASVVSASDVVYYGLNARNLNSAYFMPNLAFYALAVGRPLVTTPVGEIADVVEQQRCGVVMRAASCDAARAALYELQDGPSRLELTERARLLGETRYNWRVSADQLLEAYGQIFGQNS